MQLFIFLLLFLSSGADADGTDVTNNLFSDLGPLLALFGDTFAQQFLRESFTWLDHIIFAMAPLGILTAIIGAIRVAGPGYLRAVIGRARENRASAELDFMSSTSHEVSELWNGDGIVRTMGKGKVKQIIFLKGREQSEDLGLYTLHLAERDGLMEYEPYHGPFVKELKSLWNMAPKPWKKIKIISKQDNIDPNNINSNIKNHSNNELIDNDPRKDKSEGNDFKRSRSKINDSGRAPNISLNLHPKQTTWELVAAAILGIILQVGVLIFSAFVAYNSRFGDIVGGRPSAYAFPILASGTAVLVFGMGICALVIGESTNEDIWKLMEHKDDTTEDAQGNHESASHIPKDVEAGGTEDTHKHKSLSQRLLEVFAKRLTREGDRKLEFAHKEIRVFWLQKSFIVSDQTFNSYMLMAREGKEFVLTSCRSNDPVFGDSSDSIPRARLDKFPQQESRSNSFTEVNSYQRQSRSSLTPPLSRSPQSDKSALSWLSTLCIIGTSTGVVGFVLQFEGFRGISWACSIAQLVAILIMTIVRAIIRRGMLDSPVAEKIQDGYEIDWLALRFGNDPDFLLNLSDRKSKDAVCFVCGKLKSHLPGGSLICTAPIWKVFERIVPPKNPNEGWVSKSPQGFTPTKNSPGVQRVVNVRNRLQILTEWSNPTTKRNAESVAKAIESIIQLLHWTNDESHFIWFIEVQSNEGTPNTTTKVKLSANRENDQWMVSALDIESIISLWMYHLQNDRKSEYGVENDTGRKAHVIRSLRRVLGPSTAILKRDLEWWAGAGVAEALDTFSWKTPTSPEILSLGFGGEGKFPFSSITIQYAEILD